MSIRLAWPRNRKVCTRRVPDGPRQEDRNTLHHVHLASDVRTKARGDANGDQVTESGQVVLEVIGEMVALPRGFIVELDVYDMMGILVGRFDHADHVEGWS
jgi:hypothetical protein